MHITIATLTNYHLIYRLQELVQLFKAGLDCRYKEKRG